MFFTCYDPEILTLLRLKNPMSVEDKKNRDMDYSMIQNRFFARKVARNENIFTFNAYTAPDLHAALFKKDQTEFETLYAKYEADPSFKKQYINARQIFRIAASESFTTGHMHFCFIDELNRHTPFRDKIYTSNLCMEVSLPTEAYQSVEDLYVHGPVGKTEIAFRTPDGLKKTTVMSDRKIRLPNTKTDIEYSDLKPGDEFYVSAEDGNYYGGYEFDHVISHTPEPEVALCSLGALLPTNINNDEEYASAAYYALLMIDKCIHKAEYVFPHMAYTAKSRLSAGVGLMDIAHYMARKRLSFTTKEGKAELHRVAERHMYWLLKASLKLGQELGNAPWIDKTEWPNGWLPIDTYTRAVDEITPPVYQYDWEALRKEIIENRGIRHSVVSAFMPGESSSKAMGATNAIYPVRETVVIKTDNNQSDYWVAPDAERLGSYYESVWDISDRDIIDMYAIFQKFTDQAISADLFTYIPHGEKVTTDMCIRTYLYMIEKGLKTRYYQNSKTSVPVNFSHISEEITVTMDEIRDEIFDQYKVEPDMTLLSSYVDFIMKEDPTRIWDAKTVVSVLMGRLDITDLTVSGPGCAGGACSL